MQERLRQTLGSVVAGAVELMSELSAHSADELATAAEGQDLVLTHGAVTRVLLRYSNGHVEPPDVQRWASFVRRGYVAASNSGPTAPLEIIWESGYESSISEALGRLDDLGDLVDGSLRQGEVEDLLDSLALGD